MVRTLPAAALMSGITARPPHRPRAIDLNPVAVMSYMRKLRLSQAAVAAAARIAPSHLCEAINGDKGLTLPAVIRLATVLDCEPGTIAPTLTERFIARRPKDVV